MAGNVTADSVLQALAAGGLPVSRAPGGEGFHVAESQNGCPVPGCAYSPSRPVVAVSHVGAGDDAAALRSAARVLRARGLGLGDRGAGVFTPPVAQPPDAEFTAHLELFV
jgi:hypothetical protein